MNPSMDIIYDSSLVAMFFSLDSDLKAFVSNPSKESDHESYEAWIRHCHPENTREDKFIDHRKFLMRMCVFEKKLNCMEYIDLIFAYVLD